MESNLGVREFQRLIKEEFFHKDSTRGLAKTFIWFAEEVGELARAIRHDDRGHLEEEFADVFAWLCTMANLTGIDLEEVVRKKYAAGCPRCGNKPCTCKEAFK
ncbi:nucleotide pyrophosphohydrolase [candidate division WOR-3 bacterium]|uniref:Nucleotide pyrophosphohydrolase n=1 Tax=candidate division WOR-3 bacterium TaxID=2052148 RepID=A0A9D5QCU5_UNCW3|nr:nucleotide pyrophosphohydrolase [candidate division WOR-3 bacterium]MBD3364361.1 nucleotide pyrophosphohydrolase [candidate division WOR-3 bacterium]